MLDKALPLASIRRAAQNRQVEAIDFLLDRVLRCSNGVGQVSFASLNHLAQIRVVAYEQTLRQTGLEVAAAVSGVAEVAHQSVLKARVQLVIAVPGRQLQSGNELLGGQ